MKIKLLIISILSVLTCNESFADNQTNFYQKKCGNEFIKKNPINISKEKFIEQCVSDVQKKQRTYVIGKKINSEELSKYQKGCIEFTEKEYLKNKQLKKHELYSQCFNRQLEILEKKFPKQKPQDINKILSKQPKKIIKEQKGASLPQITNKPIKK